MEGTPSYCRGNTQIKTQGTGSHKQAEGFRREKVPAAADGCADIRVDAGKLSNDDESDSQEPTSGKVTSTAHTCAGVMRSQNVRTCPKTDSALLPVAIKEKKVGSGSSGGMGLLRRIPIGKQKLETPADHQR